MLQEKESLRKRAEQHAIAAMANLNNGYLELLPDEILDSISSIFHSRAHAASNLPPGVRVYKRDGAPLAQVVEISGFETFGFLLYRTWYEDEAAWEKFIGTVETVNKAQLNGTGRGAGLEVVRDRYMLAVANEKASLDGAGWKKLLK
jgi:hypothetical protein